MTRSEYHQAVATFDQDQAKRIQQRINAEIDQLPKNLNPNGRIYKNKVKVIEMRYERQNPKFL